VLTHAEKCYVELIKKSVNQYLYYGADTTTDTYQTDSIDRYDEFAWKLPREALPHSLLNLDQLNLLEEIILDIEQRKVPGDLLEAGVWRGGAVILMCALVSLFGMERRIIAADSFAGIPMSKETTGDPVDRWEDRWVAPLDEVKSTIKRYGLLDEKLIFIEGYFHRSLISAEISKLALIRIDADSYESTVEVLNSLYQKLSIGGVVLVDDGHLPGCLLAVIEFRQKNAIRSELMRCGNNIYWIREAD